MMNTILGAANIMEFYDTNTMAKWELRENKKFKIRKTKMCVTTFVFADVEFIRNHKN